MPTTPAFRKLKQRTANQSEVTLVIISERQRQGWGEEAGGRGKKRGREREGEEREAHINWACGRCK